MSGAALWTYPPLRGDRVDIPLGMPGGPRRERCGRVDIPSLPEATVWTYPGVCEEGRCRPRIYTQPCRAEVGYLYSNFVIYGIPEQADRDRGVIKDHKALVLDVIKKCVPAMERFNIEGAHRLGRFDPNKNRPRHRSRGEGKNHF